MKNKAAVQPCEASCPVQRTAQALDGKWTILVVRDLLGGPKRYSELQRSLLGISPRLLAARLKSLEMQGILTRTVYPTVPPSTEYTLTQLGMTLVPVVQAMAQFGNGLLEVDRRVAGAAKPRVSAGHITHVRQGKKVPNTQAAS